MNNIAIRAEGLSKKFHIGRLQKKRNTLRDTLANAFVSPFRKAGKLLRGQATGAAELDEMIWALKDVSFEIKQGEVVGIIGSNGAGKSTLLKILSRITDPTTGFAEIHGRVASLLEVGTGFHSELTGRENTYLNGVILGMKRNEIDRKFDEIVAFADVEKFIDTPVKHYSSGMYLRLAFAVAAHLEPEILIVDEVLAVGDASFQKKCLNKMQDVGQEGRTVLFVSHSMPAITRLCPRTILLNNGKVLADGPSHEVVSVYMGSEKGTKAERIWQPEQVDGDEVVRLYSVRVLSESGCVSDVIDIRQSVTIEMEYEVFQHGFTMFSYFHLINEEGIELFESFENDFEWRKRPRLPGRYVARAQIPGNFLAEGIFYITPALRTLNPEIRRFRVRDAVAFQVVDSMDGNSARGDCASNLAGVIRPLLKWETKFSPTAVRT